jgi:hypothetical protein
MKKKASQILNEIRNYIHSEELKSTCKINKEAFSRKRVSSFSSIISHVLHLLKETLQIAINDVSSILGIPTISKQAFCSARKKICPEAFIKINNKLCTEFYNDNSFKTFHGYILLAVDGSTDQLPDSPAIRDKYKVTKNQLGKTSISLGRVSNCYDVLNGITVDAILETCEIGERELAI